jgi:CO/xanthine dehydrogenase Mo-binding subunit
MTQRVSGWRSMSAVPASRLSQSRMLTGKSWRTAARRIRSRTDYALPRAGDVPAIITRHLEVESPTTVGGFRGMGEGGTIGAPAAIANALTDALMPLGADIFELPPPERLFRLVGRK